MNFLIGGIIDDWSQATLEFFLKLLRQSRKPLTFSALNLTLINVLKCPLTLLADFVTSVLLTKILRGTQTLTPKLQTCLLR